MIQIDVAALNYVVGVFIPIAVALLTKLHASTGVKAVANFLLSAISGAAVVAIQANGKIHVSNVLVGIGMTWIVSVATYYGLLKPTGVAPAVHAKTANIGVG